MTICRAAATPQANRLMLFNSYAFLAFFVAVYAVWRIARGAGHGLGSIAVLLVASLAFYGSSGLGFLALMLATMTVNYALSLRIHRHRGLPGGRLWLVVAITANVLSLFFFKYAMFATSLVSGLFDTDSIVLEIALPIGISFYTFQQITYLVDIWRGSIDPPGALRYALVVAYFPHLIAGPIVNYREMLPQLDRGASSPARSDLAVGLTIFTIGLLKKVLVADTFALVASPVFDAAAGGAAPGLLDSWAATLAYGLQIYFDFSAYSDMAIGLSRTFGIVLPINFASPYRSRSVIEFWRRWHITLSRFLRDYLYIGLGGNRHGAARRYLNVFLTMLIGGAWHGAGLTFVVWGAMHGALIALGQAWRDSRWWRPLPAVLAWGLTMAAVFLAWVPFRASDLDTMGRVYAGLFGFSGWHLDGLAYSPSTAFGPLLGALVPSWDGDVALSLVVGIVGLIACVALPNTQTLLRNFSPGLPTPGYFDGIEPSPFGRFATAWRPHPVHAALVGLAFAVCILKLNDVSEFIYFRF